jgi:hypothetical protein
MPLRCAVLLIPIVLYFCNLPNPSFGAMAKSYVSAATPGQELKDSKFDSAQAKDSSVMELSFQELTKASFDPRQRDYFQNHLGRIKGFYQPVGDKEFTLIRLKMTCCASDAVPLKARIITKDNLTGLSNLTPGAWVEVVGLIQFRKLANQDSYIPVLQVEDLGHITVSQPSGNEYEVG